MINFPALTNDQLLRKDDKILKWSFKLTIIEGNCAKDKGFCITKYGTFYLIFFFLLNLVAWLADKPKIKIMFHTLMAECWVKQLMVEYQIPKTKVSVYSPSWI